MNKKLEVLVKEKCVKFAREYWNLEYNVPILYSGKMIKTLGCYKSKTNRITGQHFPTSITYAKRLFEFHTEEECDSVIKHELTHWALGVQGKPRQDGHPVFEAEIRRIGASSTGTIKRQGEIHTVLCGCCKVRVTHATRENGARKFCETIRYTSRCCKSQLVYGGTVDLGDKSKSYLSQVMNQTTPKVEVKKEVPKQPLTKTEAPKKQAPQAPKQATTEMKPAEAIKTAFASMMNKLTKKQLNQLTNETFCKDTFGIKYSFLKEFKSNEDRKVNGSNRYYSGTITIFGKQYIMTNDLYKNNVTRFVDWAKA